MEEAEEVKEDKKQTKHGLKNVKEEYEGTKKKVQQVQESINKEMKKRLAKYATSRRACQKINEDILWRNGSYDSCPNSTACTLM